MVTVDMSNARAQITKRQRRMRRAAQRRIQRQHRAHLRELHAAKAARQARQRAIANWNAEEQRLQRLQQTATQDIFPQNQNTPIVHEKPRVVTFAEHVLVTKIPVSDTDDLPKPITSPIEVSISGNSDGDNTDSDDDSSINRSSSIAFSRLSEEAFGEEDDDPEFIPDHPSDISIPSRPIHRPRRKITVKRLNVPLEQIMLAKGKSKSNASPSSKRPRAECDPQPQSSSPLHVSHASSPMPVDGKGYPCIKQSIRQSVQRETLRQGQNQYKQLSCPNDASSAERPKKRRRRTDCTYSPNLNTNAHNISDATSGSMNKSSFAEDQANRVSPDQPSDSVSIESKTRHDARIINPSKCTEKEKPVPLTANDVEKGQSSSLTQSHDREAERRRKSPSLSVPNGRPNQNGRLLNGLHYEESATNGKKKSVNSANEDKELDDMFGDLARKKAANRGNSEKTAVQEKRVCSEACEAERHIQHKKKKVKKGPTRYTKDGLRIMTYEQIVADQPPGLNGDCPFDCSCCF